MLCAQSTILQWCAKCRGFCYTNGLYFVILHFFLPLSVSLTIDFLKYFARYYASKSSPHFSQNIPNNSTHFWQPFKQRDVIIKCNRLYIHYLIYESGIIEFMWGCIILTKKKLWLFKVVLKIIISEVFFLIISWFDLENFMFIHIFDFLLFFILIRSLKVCNGFYENWCENKKCPFLRPLGGSIPCPSVHPFT